MSEDDIDPTSSLFSLRYSLDNYPPLSIGKSLHILFASDEKSLLSSSKQYEAVEPVAFAFHSLHRHLLQKGSAVVSSICTPLIENWSNTTRESKKIKILHITRWIFERHDKLLCQEFVKIINSDNKKHKLATIQILHSLVNMFCIASSSPGTESKQSQKSSPLIVEINEETRRTETFSTNFQIPQISQLLIPRILNFSQFIEPLVLCATTNSLVKDIHRIPTVLTVAAADCAINISYALALVDYTIQMQMKTQIDENIENENERITCSTLPEKKPFSFLLQLETLLKLVQEMIHWYEEARPLFTVALKEIAEWIRIHSTIFKQSLTSQERGTIEKIVRAVWILWAPFLIENSSLTSKKNILKETHRFIHQLRNPMEVVDDDKEKELLNETTSHLLSCLCLLWGRLPVTSLSKMIKKLNETFYNTLLSQIIHTTSERVQKLSICLLQTFIAHSEYFDTEKLIDELLLFVQRERDKKTTKVVVGFLGELLVKYPKKVVKLFSSLDSNEKSERMNALDVLTEVFRLNRELLSFNPELSEILSRELLSRLHDEELTLRTQAATLFAHLHPKEVIPKLVQMTLHSDVRVRSAADKALVTLLRQHKNIPQTVLTLLNSLRQLISDPSQVQFDQQQVNTIIERTMKLLPLWAAEMPSHIFVELIPETLKSFFTYPSESLLVKFLSVLSPQFSNFPMLIFPEIVQKLKDQPKLSEEILSDPTRVQHIIFDRLAPLLVLKTLSLRAFQFSQLQDTVDDKPSMNKTNIPLENEKKVQKSLSEECVKLLLERITQPFEFDEIRKLAAEICARFSPQMTFSHALSLLQHFEEIKQINITKVLIYFFCHTLITYGKQTEQSIVTLFPLLLQPLLWLCAPQTSSSSSVSEIQNLQLGCIECIGICLTLSLESQQKDKETQNAKTLAQSQENLSHRPSKKPLIEVIDSEIDTSTLAKKSQNNSLNFPRIVKCFSDILPFILNVIRLGPTETNSNNNNENITSQQDESLNDIVKNSVYDTVHNCRNKAIELQLKICLVNVLINVLKKLTTTQQNYLANFVFPVLNRYYFDQSNHLLKAAYLQFLFNLAFHLKERIDPFALELYTLCIDSLKSSDSEVRLGGLKLIGSLMTSIPSLFEDSSRFIQTQFLLESIANIDNDRQCRELAEKLVHIAFPHSER